MAPPVQPHYHHLYTYHPCPTTLARLRFRCSGQAFYLSYPSDTISEHPVPASTVVAVTQSYLFTSVMDCRIWT